jgi:hypothetical protein
MGVIRDRLEAELPVAIRARDRPAVAACRIALAAIANAEAVDPGARPGRGVFSTEVARRDLTDADVEAIVAAAREELRASADELASLGQPARADDLRQQADVLTRVLRETSCS